MRFRKFLALALWHLKDFDLAVMREANTIGLPIDRERISPEAVLGIEVNPYAAELARLTVWIAELQWQLRNNFELKQRHPILGRLDGIVCADALIDRDGLEATWPAADVVIGNPPFLGGKRLRSALRDSYVEKLFSLFGGRVPAEADLVTYWFRKASDYIASGKLRAAGLVATNSIRGGANRKVLDEIGTEHVIFDAWADEPWVIDGVAVRVSLVCFESKEGNHENIRLDGHAVDRINTDLTSSIDLIAASRLPENAGIAFMGDTKGGMFDVPGKLARQWLALPVNPNGRPNSDVLRPWVNGLDITRRPSDKWIIDFGSNLSAEAAALYELPFRHCEQNIRPERRKNRREIYKKYWWRHVEPRPGMWKALNPLQRFIATPTVAKHRLFVWLTARVCPDHQIIAIARDDDTSFGILHSRFHEAWSLRLGTWLGVGNDPRYTPTSTFETFPFPERLTSNIPADDYAKDPRAIAIATAARELDRLRNAWLNPTNLIRIVPEVVAGFPDRIVPINSAAESELKKRTLTNLYNERPTWLANAHSELDAAVAAAYGWNSDISNEEALARLLELNKDRAAQQIRIAEPKRHRAKKPPTPEQLRREPPLPPMAITGGMRQEANQSELDLNTPLLTSTDAGNKRSRQRSPRR